MDETATAFDWRTAISETYQDFVAQVINHAPQLVGAIALLVLGWIIAHFSRLGTKKLIYGLDSLFNRVSKHDGVRREGLKKSYALIISQFVFWAILIFFIAASANLVGWKLFTGWMENIVTVLPNLIMGLLIILAGFLLGNAARSGIARTAESTGITQGAVLARVAQIIILVSSVIIGIELIGLNVQFLTSIIVVVIGILLAGAALAFSLGAKTMVANFIGAQQTRKHCRIGEHLKIDGYEGEILEVTQTAVVLDTEYGRAVIPSKLFQERVSELRSDAPPSKPSRAVKSAK